MTFKNRRARAAQPSGGGVHPSALAIDAGLATITTFVGRERSVFGKLGLTRVGTAHAPQATKDGRGLAATASATYWSGAAGAKVVCANTSFAVLLSFYLRAPGQTNRYALFERLTGGTGSQNAVLYGYATDQFEFYSPSATGTDPRTGSGITVADSLPHTLIYTYDGATWSGLLDGRVIFSTSRSFAVPINDATGVSSIGDAAGGNSLDICVLHHATFARGLPLNLARRLSSPTGKWGLFAGSKRRAWAPGAAGGGSDIDIAGVVGNAVASGVTGAPAVSIDIAGSVANAVAAGITGSTQVATEIAGSVGNAVAAGVAGSASVTNDINIDGVVGNAVAAGVAGDTSVGSDISISGTVGNAVAAGTAGVPGVPTTIAATVGNATAAGVSGLAAIGVLIDGSVGNAAAAGITGTLTLDIVVAGVVANAVAAGVTGSASVDAAAVSATPGYTITAKRRRLEIRK